MFHIYVDGSCLGNQNVDSDTPAGWGVVAITGSNDLGRGNGEIFHEFNGKVVTDSSESKFIGAEGIQLFVLVTILFVLSVVEPWLYLKLKSSFGFFCGSKEDYLFKIFFFVD